MMSRIPGYAKIGFPVLTGLLAMKKLGYGKLSQLRSYTHARAETDLFLDEDVLPEFSIELDELSEYARTKYDYKLKTRDEHLSQMMDGSLYDIVVIGAGASGAGVALDAASRGLKVAVVEKNDFGSGTSSKSTKLAHGGIRYLEQMMKRQGNVKQSYSLLKEALAERNYFLDSNPFQNSEIKIVIPDKSMLKTLFYNFPGTLVYHLIYLINSMNQESSSSIHGPKVVSPWGLRKLFPNIGIIRKYWGTMMHEGQFIDTRQGLNCLLTSTIHNYDKGFQGANIANYVTFKEFLKDENGKICGVAV